MGTTLALVATAAISQSSFVLNKELLRRHEQQPKLMKLLDTLEDDDEGQARLGLTRDNCAPLTPRLLSKLGVLAAWADIKLLTSL
jgi:hypothetical protein